MLQSITEKYRPKTLNELVFVNKTFENKMKEWCSKKELDTLWPEVKRLKNPHKYYVDLSKPLWDLKNELLKK